jgi:hypothetical protein
MIWVLFGILLMAWLLALIAGGCGALIHSVITIYRSGSGAFAVPTADQIPRPEIHS